MMQGNTSTYTHALTNYNNSSDSISGSGFKRVSIPIKLKIGKTKQTQYKKRTQQHRLKRQQ